MEVVFSSKYEGKVWKLYSDFYSDFVLLEERNEEVRSAKFYLYNTTDYTRTEIVPYEDESWWFGVHDFYKGVCVFHKYLDGIEPVPKGVLLYSVFEERVVFENEEYQYLGREDGIIRASDSESEEVEIRLDEITTKAAIDKVHVIVEPRYYDEDSEHYATFTRFLNEHFQLEAVGAIEYLEYAERVIISFNRMIDNKLENLLFIMKDNGDIQYEVSLTSGVKGVGMGTFFQYDDTLWFVQNKNELKILRLV